MTNKAAVKKTALKKSSNPSCPVLKKLQSYSQDELHERRRLKNMKRKQKREAVKLRKAEEAKKTAEEAKNLSSADEEATAAVIVTLKKKQRPPEPKLPVEVVPYLHKPHSFDKDMVPQNLKESFWYTGQV